MTLQGLVPDAAVPAIQLVGMLVFATRILHRLPRCRKQRPELRRRSFSDVGAMTWHGAMPHQAEWSDETRLVAFTISSASQGGLYCAFNTSHKPQTVTLPHWPGLVWQPVMDTGKVLLQFYKCMQLCSQSCGQMQPSSCL